MPRSGAAREQPAGQSTRRSRCRTHGRGSPPPLAPAPLHHAVTPGAGSHALGRPARESQRRTRRQPAPPDALSAVTMRFVTQQPPTCNATARAPPAASNAAPAAAGDGSGSALGIAPLPRTPRRGLRSAPWPRHPSLLAARAADGPRSDGGGLRGLEAVQPLLEVVVSRGRPRRGGGRRLGRGAHDAVHRGAAHQRCARGAREGRPSARERTRTTTTRAGFG